MTSEKRKCASQMTGNEIAQRVFPKPVHEHLKRLANPEEPTPTPRSRRLQKESN